MKNQQTALAEDKYLNRLLQLGSEYEKELIALAHAEYEYSSIKTQTFLILKNTGESASAISLQINGIPEVAQKRLSRDIAHANVKAKMEQINILKLQIKSLGEL